MAKEAPFTLTFDGPLTGILRMEDTGSTEPPPGNGEPAPPPAADEGYIWFRDGQNMGAYVRDQKLNQFMTPERPGETIQAVYRAGTLAGQFMLPPDQPVQDGDVYCRFVGLPFHFPGLHSWTPGTCWYRNADNYDLTPGLCRFEDSNPNGGGPYHLYFYFADPNNSGRMKRLQNRFPFNWQQYGLHLSWTVLVP